MKRKVNPIIIGLTASFLAASCTRKLADQDDTESTRITIEEATVPMYEKPVGSYIRTAEASGELRYANDRVITDASNTSQGYVMVLYKGEKDKIKVQITKSGSDPYSYDLNARNAFEVFPLTEGNGSYSVKVFENISGNQYSQAFSQDIQVSIVNQFLPFLYPNQYVNFTADSLVVKKASELTAAQSDQIGVVTAVYNYVIDNFTYDEQKARTVQSGYLPDVDLVYTEKKGICFDYAAVMTAMLRSQNIPTKLVVGYTGSIYHAWVSVYIDGIGWINQIIYFDGTNWKLMDPTFASSGRQSREIMDYINTSANYKAKYSY